MRENPFDEVAKLSVIQGKIVTSVDGWQITQDRYAVDLWHAIVAASDRAKSAMEYQESRKRPYLIALCRQAREAIPAWNILARRDFDKNMIQWLGQKEAELEAAAEDKVLNADE